MQEGDAFVREQHELVKKKDEEGSKVRRFEQRRSRLNSFLFVCSSSLCALVGRLDNKSCVYELVLPQSNGRKQEKKFVGIVGRRFCKKKRRETAQDIF